MPSLPLSLSPILPLSHSLPEPQVILAPQFILTTIMGKSVAHRAKGRGIDGTMIEMPEGEDAAHTFRSCYEFGSSVGAESGNAIGLKNVERIHTAQRM